MPGYQGNNGFRGGNMNPGMKTPPPAVRPVGGPVPGGVRQPPIKPPRMGVVAPPVAINSDQSPQMDSPWGRVKPKPPKKSTPIGTKVAPGKPMPYDWVNGFKDQQASGPTVSTEYPIPGAPAPSTPTVSDPYPVPPPQPGAPGQPIPGQNPGVQVHHNMYAGNNRGQVRVNPQTGQQEILMGAGGGEQYQWMPYDANNYGMKQNADMFARYGAGWTSGSGATSMHSPDIAQVLREQLGREPTMYEIYDVYYGKNRGVQGIAYNGGTSGA